jgi:DNA-directed RNA polymerase specialized sigma24 family protein
MLNDDDLDVRGAQPHHPADLTRLASFDQNRSLLLSIAYRMLGSVGDAEDMVQDMQSLLLCRVFGSIAAVDKARPIV